MTDYRVPKHEARVTLEPVFGQARETTLYLGETAAAHTGGETVSDLLNSGTAFVPVTEDGRLTLVRTNAIRWVRIPEPEVLEWRFSEVRAGATRLTVECVFSDTDRLTGTMFATGPASDRRVTDLVRDAHFTHLENEEGLFLVNLRQVTLIRALDP